MKKLCGFCLGCCDQDSNSEIKPKERKRISIGFKAKKGSENEASQKNTEATEPIEKSEHIDENVNINTADSNEKAGTSIDKTDEKVEAEEVSSPVLTSIIADSKNTTGPELPLVSSKVVEMMQGKKVSIVDEQAQDSASKEKTALKSRLKALVQKFIKRSCSDGYPVELINNSDGNSSNVIFKLDESVQSFYFLTPTSSPTTSDEALKIELISVTEIHFGPKDSTISHSMKPSENETISKNVLSLKTTVDGYADLTLKFDSFETCENFYICFKILRMADLISNTKV